MTGAYAPPHHVATIIALIAVALVGGGLAWLAEEHDRRGAAIVIALGGISVLGPLALAPTRFDKFFYRNLIGGWVLLAIGLGVVLSSRRAGRVGLAVVALACVLELGSLGIILHRPALQRDDWRSAVKALGRRNTQRTIITNPSYDRVAIELYRPGVRAMSSTGTKMREIVFLGFARLPLDFRPPPGFRRVEQRRIQHIVLVRYRARTPRIVTADQIAARGRFDVKGVLAE